MKSSQRLLKNVLAGGIGTALSGVLQFAAVIILTRKLGLRDFGIYSVLATLAFLLSRFADLGTSAVLLRDLAIAPESADDLFSAALTLSWCIVAAITLTAYAVALGVTAAPELRRVIELMAISGLIQYPCACYASLMRAREDNELEAIGSLLHKLGLLALLCFCFAMRAQLQGVAIAHLLASSTQLVYCAWVTRKKYFSPSRRFDFGTWAYLLRESLPFGSAAVVRLAGEQGELTVLAWIAGLSAVGLYSAVYRITIGLRFVPQAMVIAVFPAYSRAGSRVRDSGSDAPEFQRIYEFGIRILTIISVPLSLIIFLSSRPLVTVVLGPSYLPAVPALKVLSIAAGVFFVSSPYPYLLTALGEQSFLLISSAVAATLRILLVLILARMFGIVGASWAVLIVESCLLLAWVSHLARKHFYLDIRDMLRKTLPAAVAMSVPFLLCQSQSRPTPALPAAILISSMIYCAVLLKTRAFSEEEMRLAADALKFIRPFVAQWSGRRTPQAG